ncbi:unnamed protein product [Owenia fusiformis]|uniref:Uncharacterized protein n=1 Tax=Owenia fusiformis TaxID=6347 RepID=A0A8J1Y4C8_OWEFU|nr:unnamed protein product [Owenia fusiformis]
MVAMRLALLGLCVGILVMPIYSQTTCTSKHDLVFVMDASGSLGLDNFGTIRFFVRSVIQELDIGSDATQVALVTFGDTGVVEFYLNTYDNKEDVSSAVDRLEYSGGSTDTLGALSTVRAQVLTSNRGDRADVQDTIVMITDGASKTGDPTEIANLLRSEQDAIVYTIGIGTSELNPEELVAIANAGSPSGGGSLDSYSIIVDDFSKLNPLATDVSSQICLSQPPCETLTDIVFMIDGSGSMGAENFTRVLDFVSSIVNGFNIGNEATMVGALTFSSGAEVNFQLIQHSTKSALLTAIAAIEYPGASTDTIAAFEAVRGMFTAENGDRSGVPNFAVIITDGASKTGDPTEEATATKDDDITVMAIGIRTEELNEEELTTMASNPKSKYALLAENFADLTVIGPTVKNELCNSGGCEASYRITPYDSKIPGVGRPEVRVNGQWKAICDDQWDDLDAKVICSCLYPDSDPVNYKALWRRDTTLDVLAIGIDDLVCEGDEEDIFSCKYTGEADQNCDASTEAAGIACIDIAPYVPVVPIPQLACNTSAMETCFNKSEIIASKLDLQPACSDITRQDKGDFLCYDIPHGQCTPAELTTDSSGKKYCYRYEQKSRESTGSPVFDENWDVTTCCNVAKNGSVGFGYQFFVPTGNYSSSGNTDFDMKCYLNPNFDGDAIEYPVKVLTGQDLYCKVCVDTEDEDMLLVVPTCWLSGPVGEEGPMYSFIEDKCPVVSTLGLNFYPISRHCWGFKFTAMNYNDKVEMYVSCDTFACDSNLDGKPYCDRTCIDGSNRKKRDVGDKFTPKKQGRVDRGPFIVEAGGAMRSDNGEYIVGQKLSPEELKKYMKDYQRGVNGNGRLQSSILASFLALSFILAL